MVICDGGQGARKVTEDAQASQHFEALLREALRLREFIFLTVNGRLRSQTRLLGHSIEYGAALTANNDRRSDERQLAAITINAACSRPSPSSLIYEQQYLSGRRGQLKFL